MSTAVVSKTTSRAETAGLDWEKVSTLDEEALERLLCGIPQKLNAERPEPDPAAMHRELKKAG